MTNRHAIDPDSAVRTFAAYVASVNVGHLAEASAARLRLLDLGVVVAWQPGKSLAARPAALAPAGLAVAS